MHVLLSDYNDMQTLEKLYPSHSVLPYLCSIIDHQRMVEERGVGLGYMRQECSSCVHDTTLVQGQDFAHLVLHHKSLSLCLFAWPQAVHLLMHAGPFVVALSLCCAINRLK